MLAVYTMKLYKYFSRDGMKALKEESALKQSNHLVSDNVHSDALPFAESQKAVNKGLFNYWRFRIMYSMMIGYAGFYMLRQNFSAAMPYISLELGYSKIQLGAVISIANIIYGFGKIIAGYFGDRNSARFLMAFGLLTSAIINFTLGFSQSLAFLMSMWVLHSCFQSLGWPPCARLLNHWFSPKELATKWAVWNSSQQIGAGFMLLISPFIILHFGWRYLFLIPGILCVGLSIFLYNRLRDTPESLGLPSIEHHHGLNYEDPDKDLPLTELLVKKIFNNRLVWYVCFANFFVYYVRMSIFNWAPTFLREAKGSSLYTAAAQSAVYDIAGILGGVCAGYLSDRFTKGYRGRVGSIFMLLLSIVALIFWKSPSGSVSTHFFCMIGIGFLITGPQVLVGVAASDFSSKRAAGTATGLTGAFGYAGSSFAGVGLAIIAEKEGWDMAFMSIVVSGILAAFFFSLTWNHRSRALEKS